MASEVNQKVKDFFAAYPSRSFDKGQILVYAGDDPPGIFYLVKGQVREYDISQAGEEVVVNVFKPAAFFPMSWAINRTPNQYFFETLNEVILHQAPADEVLALIKADPDIIFDLLSRVYSGTDGLLRRMAHLMGGGARNRVLFELINSTLRFGKRQADGSYIVEMHGNDLAAQSGLSRETISREIQKLKKQGLIDVSHHGFVIKDLEKMQKELGESL